MHSQNLFPKAGSSTNHTFGDENMGKTSPGGGGGVVNGTDMSEKREEGKEMSCEDDNDMDDEEEDDEAEDDSGSCEDGLGDGDIAKLGSGAQNRAEPITELGVIRANLQLLNHQMALLMRALNVSPCKCTECECALKVQKIFPERQQQQLTNGIKTNSQMIEIQHPTGDRRNFLNVDSYESSPRGRRSKYCTPSEKKAVAGYVQIHGASAAAKKFNIPPAVAAYYHRREFKVKSNAALNRAITLQSHHAMNKSHDSSAGEGESQNQSQQQHSDEKGTDQQIAQLWQGNYSGSPAFLRGRGRGRPKLIGDELDAELVEHMVQLKQTNPRAHLSASQALAIARDYINEKAPGLLEEHGGQVKLKNTWAMKLVARVQEREREIQLGLPAGTLQNLPRSVLQSTNDALVNELLGQNLLSQQINVNALLAVATGTADKHQQNEATTSTSETAVLNAMLGMATAGGAELFGSVVDHHQQPGSSGIQQMANDASEDAAIKQLLASLRAADQQDALGAANSMNESIHININGGI